MYVCRHMVISQNKATLYYPSHRDRKKVPYLWEPPVYTLCIYIYIYIHFTYMDIYIYGTPPKPTFYMNPEGPPQKTYPFTIRFVF